MMITSPEAPSRQRPEQPMRRAEIRVVLVLIGAIAWSQIAVRSPGATWVTMLLGAALIGILGSTAYQAPRGRHRRPPRFTIDLRVSSTTRAAISRVRGRPGKGRGRAPASAGKAGRRDHLE